VYEVKVWVTVSVTTTVWVGVTVAAMDVGVNVDAVTVRRGALRYVLQNGRAAGKLVGVRSRRRRLSALHEFEFPRSNMSAGCDRGDTGAAVASSAPQSTKYTTNWSILVFF